LNVEPNGEIISTIALSGGATVFALSKNVQRSKFDATRTSSREAALHSRQSPPQFEIRDDHCSAAEIFG
jgi:hypothetical protein